jgi:NTP pyrophosphatase (non-canonical NTP hydrolase)
MKANEYQQLAARTLIDAPDFELQAEDWTLTLTVLRLAADVGALADYVKKAVYHQHGLDRGAATDRVAEVVRSLSNVAQALNEREPRGPTRATSVEIMRVWNVIGLVGETGEVAELRTANLEGVLAKELGDVLWYVAALCTRAGLDMGAVMEANIEKLRARYPDGYSAEASRVRADLERP